LTRAESATTLDHQMLVCPQCGGAYAVGQGFCPMDGVPLSVAPGSDPADPRPGDELVGRILDRRYRLDRRIGTGSMGHVYRATHTLIGKTIAIKVLRDEHVGDPKVAERFAQEARLASRIKHPNVVDISDYGSPEDGRAYFVMELLEGRTLADLVDTSGPIAPKIALGIAMQIALGLEAAHDEDIVHRDLKAENVFLCESRTEGSEYLVKLLDFGIARATGPRITVAGSLLGTPEYMSPEQARGFDVDARTDLYALGIILFEMLVGRVPFASANLAEIIRMHVHDRPPELHEVAPGLEPLAATARLIRRLLAKAPDERPPSAREVATLLHAAMDRDFGADAADRLHRSTLALGSKSDRPGRAAQAPPPAAMAPTPDAQRPMGWGARTGRTHRPADEAPITVRDPAHGQRPELPPLATTDPASLGSGGTRPRIGIIVGGTALVAAAATFGVVAVLGGLQHAQTSSVEAPVISAEPKHPAAGAAALPVTSPSPEPSTRAELQPTIQAAELETTRAPDVVETTTSATKPPMEPSQAPARSSEHPTPKKTSVRSPPLARKRAEAPGPEAPPAQPPTAGDEAPPPAEPKPVKKPSPGDLKDPFSPN
jgi:serine/threonine protein kinase